MNDEWSSDEKMSFIRRPFFFLPFLYKYIYVCINTFTIRYIIVKYSEYIERNYESKHRPREYAYFPFFFIKLLSYKIPSFKYYIRTVMGDDFEEKCNALREKIVTEFLK